ncbi:hypothetical protein Aperf_G00000124322 [Anoplocephala perfoliata]
MDPPHLSPALNPNDLYSLAGICSDPRAKTFADYLRNFKRRDALRVQGRQRWHAIARQQRLSSSPPSKHNGLAEIEENRRNLRYIVHRAARAPSPLSPTRRNCRHGTRLNDMGVRYCSNGVSPHLRIHDEHHAEHGAEATEIDSKIGTHDLQIMHIFQPSKTSPGRGFVSLAKFHPYKPHLVTAETLESLEEYAVTIWGVHRADKVKRLTLAETLNPIYSVTTLSVALGEEIKKQRALQEGYDLAQVTSLEVLNALEERSLLLTASRDGCIRVWQDYDGKTGAGPRLLTSWVALETQVPLLHSQRTAGVGLVTSWSDCSLHHLLHVSGDVRVVRVFDTDCEARIADFKTLAECPVTRLARASVAEGNTGSDHIFAAGFADGRVKLFDVRLPSHNAIIFEGSCGGGTGAVLDLAFAPFQADRRFYAVTSSGAVGAWQLEARSPNFNSSSWLPITAESSGSYQNPKDVIRSAHLQVELPCTRSHMVIYTSGRGFNVARLDDGQLIASYQPESKANPTAVAMHSYEPYIALAMNDTSIHLLKFKIST